MRRAARRLSWLLTILLLVPTAALAGDGDDDDDDGEEEDDGLTTDLTKKKDDEKDKKNYRGDANSPWFHVGGGFGLVQPMSDFVEVGNVFAGRFVLGGGGYTYGFYGGGGLEISGNAYAPFSLHGLGMIGVHIPVPVVHPMFGLKIGVGFSALDLEPAPEVTIGGNLGVIIREFDGRLGFRFMVEPAVVVSMIYDYAAAEVFFTFALVL